MSASQPLLERASYGPLVVAGVVLPLLGLPLAVWLVSYAFEGLVDEMKQRTNVISEHSTGIDLFLDLDVIEMGAVDRTSRLLEQALAAIELKTKQA